ncbi:YlbF family regulator [Peptococcaceae bacterium 1198_IL3148]
MSQNIVEQATLLGNLLKESAEFKEVRAKEAAMLQDAEAQKLLNEQQQVQQSLQMKQMQGQQLTQEDMAAYKELESKMLANPLVKDYFDTRDKFENLLNTVNQTINNALMGQQDSCGSGCDCNTGCHCGGC